MKSFQRNNELTNDKPDNINQLTAHLFRENSGKMVAVLTRMFGLGQIERVMDVVQDAFVAALTRWRYSGIPDNPSAWLMQVAKNKAINALSRDARLQKFSPSVYLKNFDNGFENQYDILLLPGQVRDSQMRLLLSCCQPRFSHKNQIILTLNILSGFGTPEIANALLMSEESVKKALTRTKAALRDSGNSLETLSLKAPRESMETVHTILYLIFNEGYKTTRSKEAINNELCFEAIRLAKLLVDDKNPNNGEANALLSLMFFNLSRFPARRTADNEWLTLEEQDRTQWNRVFIEEGYSYLNEATNSVAVTRYHIEAIIASIHCAAPTFAETDWKQIANLYCQLEVLEPASPLIALNRIIAESYLPDSQDCISALDEIEVNAGLKDHYLLHVAKGDIYKRQGELKEAQASLERAFRLAVSPIDKEFLKRRILQCQLRAS